MKPDTPAPRRRHQRDDRRPRTHRTITADVNPDTIVRLGESTYHNAVVFEDGSVLGGCPSVDAQPATLRDAALRGLRPCQSCTPPDYLEDADATQPETPPRQELRARLNDLPTDALVGLTWTTTPREHWVTVEGHLAPTAVPRETARVTTPARESDLVVRRGRDTLDVYAATTDGNNRLGQLVDVLPLDRDHATTVVDEHRDRELRADGGTVEDGRRKHPGARRYNRDIDEFGALEGTGRECEYDKRCSRAGVYAAPWIGADAPLPQHLCPFHLGLYGRDHPEQYQLLREHDRVADPDPFVRDDRFYSLEEVPPRARNGEFRRLGLDHRGLAHFMAADEADATVTLLRLDGRLDFASVDTYSIANVSLGDYLEDIHQSRGWVELDTTLDPVDRAVPDYKEVVRYGD